uniref:Integral membrane protein DGCR2/IDD n=1 Tax=Cacopsylla melanoneura TaxID=428564 RepID=A0A8D8QA73_9HEMI
MEGQYCVDLLNNTVLPSKIYSPGPDPCTSCTCDNGAPTYCKVITCATPKNCRLVHPHTTCCNFECHENIDLTSVTLGGSSLPERVVSFNEITLRFVVIAFTVFVSMCLVAFLVHRLKKRKLRGRQTPRLGVEDNRIGYIEGSIRGSIRYLPEYVAYEPPHAALWKPHGYFPTGEAPPPYEEAVAAARAEAALQTRSLPSETPSLGIVSTVTMPYHRTIPLNLLSGNSHATTTTTAVIVRSNVHYDTLPQASQTNTIESNNNNNIRHPSLSRTPAVTSITSPPPPPLLQ